MSIKKIGIILFIFGALISVFSGAFDVSNEMAVAKVVVLIFLGLAVGMLNVNHSQENQFMLASATFIIASQAVISYMDKLYILGNLAIMLQNLIVFIAPAAVVIGLKNIIIFGSESEIKLKVSKKVKEKRKFLVEAWDIILLVSVSFVFVILILESFFKVDKIQGYLDITDWIITGIFLIDLVILFSRANSFIEFLKKNWVDIIAVLPLGYVFRIAKVVRAVKIIKIFCLPASTAFFSFHFYHLLP